MYAAIVACLAAILIAVAAAAFLNYVAQQPSAQAFTEPGVRL